MILVLLTQAQTTKRAQMMHMRHERQCDEKDKKWQRQERQQLKGVGMCHYFEFDISKTIKKKKLKKK